MLASVSVAEQLDGVDTVPVILVKYVWWVCQWAELKNTYLIY